MLNIRVITESLHMSGLPLKYSDALAQATPSSDLYVRKNFSEKISGKGDNKYLGKG